MWWTTVQVGVGGGARRVGGTARHICMRLEKVEREQAAGREHVELLCDSEHEPRSVSEKRTFLCFSRVYNFVTTGTAALHSATAVPRNTEQEYTTGSSEQRHGDLSRICRTGHGLRRAVKASAGDVDEVMEGGM